MPREKETERKVYSDIWLEDEVYIIHEQEQRPWLVIRVAINPNGILYGLCRGTEETDSYRVEISKDINPKRM